ncbi:MULTISPECIES: hypothetical protein [unclassified Burkholderia]|uniref:hypothetical protein n=1 Tax=unclassified Burkholderia TaxID=2613784 RepID=UPI00117EE021|nr:MULTISPECIES: hypothetical protein [unclassified Burkholderia]MDN7427242.1 hypothetical protein [Burkholderia sp. AU45388]
MFGIELHKKYLESVLAAGKPDNLACFGVWCCIGLAHNDAIFEFLATHAGVQAHKSDNELAITWIGCGTETKTQIR